MYFHTASELPSVAGSIPHDLCKTASRLPRMTEFLAALLALPTILFTGMLSLVLLYWLTVLAGALDIHVGSHDGGGHDVGHDAGHDVGHHSDHQADMAPGGHETHGFLEFLSYGKVPVTIIVSIFTFLAWMLCMAGEFWLRAPLSAMISGPLFSLALFPAATIPSLIVTGYLVRPLRGIFNQHVEHGEEGLVGRMVRITSRTADREFGTATCDNAGAGILMNVVCRDGVTLIRDDMAVVVEYDSSKQVYHIAPFSHVSAETVALGNGLPPALPPAESLTPSSSTIAKAVSLESQKERPQ